MQQCWLDDNPGAEMAPTRSCNIRPGSNWSEAPSVTAIEKYLDWQCSEGYRDRLCAVCQDGYGASGACRTVSAGLFLLRALLLVLL